MTLWVLVEASVVAQLIGISWFAAGIVVYAVGRRRRGLAHSE